ncbi:hypothetical protein GCM10010218_32580 [Streptomyces mashuensis]|uniref:Metal-dependent hydrolase n=1 Tax=Streptomyces mashuensis TaxID=33904 RepID=A0A919B4H2_9ACTN|nr:metal-dependent hydrolase [Streptomyces mashuensis]GHF48581.1 hypothetical protein GCM10010218_32580 [Streptomyces mashuensis]
MNSTEVLFPQGTLTATARVDRLEPAGDGRTLLVVDRTPFHPLDHTWPDQPADTGTVTLAGRAYDVVDVVTGAAGPDGDDGLHLGRDIPVRRGTPGWTFVAVHVLATPDGAPAAAPGDEAVLAADPELRADLSRGHTGCHLMSLALNKCLAGLWSKTPRTDPLGNPDFDQAAITESRIVRRGSVDRYRLGKSLRKSGFDSQALTDRLPELEAAVTAQVTAWVEAAAPAGIHCEGPHLDGRRWWTCALPDGEARMPCGGTHLTNTSELGKPEIRFESAPGELVITTGWA